LLVVSKRRYFIHTF